jgi:hypothetical protein
MAIDVRNAVENAAEYLKSFYPECRNILIEEVELNEADNEWLITLSYLYDETGYGHSLLSGPKKFKTFKINSLTGTVISMKIKDVR